MDIEKSCVFCEIIAGNAPARIIDRSDQTIAILALEGHPLIIPRKHRVDIFDPTLTTAELSDIALSVQRVSLMTRKVYGVEAVTILSANGRIAGQEIMHLHFHVIPRESNDRKVRFVDHTIPSAQILDNLAIKFIEV